MALLTSFRVASAHIILSAKYCTTSISIRKTFSNWCSL